MESRASSQREVGWMCCLVSPRDSTTPQQQSIDVTDCASYYLECIPTSASLLLVVGPFTNMFTAAEFKMGIITNHKPPYNSVMQLWADKRHYGYIATPTMDQLRDLLNPSNSLLRKISPVS